MKPKSVRAKRDLLWAMAGTSLAEALETVSGGWPQQDSDRRLARAAFAAWLNESAPGRPPDPQLLGDRIHQALVGLYDEPLLSALAMRLLLDLYSEWCEDNPGSGGLKH